MPRLTLKPFAAEPLACSSSLYNATVISACRFLPAGLSNCSAQVTAGVIDWKLGFANFQMPDDSPVYGCRGVTATTAGDCLKTSTAYNIRAAVDGNAFTNTNYGTMSQPVTDLVRFPYVFYQVQLDVEYSDIKALDIYTTTANLASTSNLDIFLSPTRQYLCNINTANCAAVCVSKWNATNAAPTKNTVTCGQTLANTRYVTLHRSTASSSMIYIYELTVIRAVDSACVTCSSASAAVPVGMTSATYTPSPVDSALKGVADLADNILGFYGYGLQVASAAYNRVQIQLDSAYSDIRCVW